MLLFCCDPLNARQADPVFDREVAAAQKLGLDYALVDFEALTLGSDAGLAVRRVPQQENHRLSIYRGWMLKPSAYRLLYSALDAKGVRLLNDPVAYRHCHYLPDSYSKIESYTPRSVWLSMADHPTTGQIMDTLMPFGDVPIIVKDYVKSRKHEWNEACFIPSASDRQAVERIVARFVELQEEDLNEGLVFREYIEFEPLTKHEKSGMPLTKEYRLFFLDGEPILVTQYWDQGDYREILPPVQHFTDIAKRVESRFFTMDVAKRKDSDWMIVELGDGQVAGMPENADVEQFYSTLANRWPM